MPGTRSTTPAVAWPRSPRRPTAACALSSAAPALWAPRPNSFPTGATTPFSPTGPAAPRRFDADHRAHAVIELAIRDLKAEGLAHCPSGHYSANAAWVVIAALAHNLVRWVARLGLGITGPVVAKTVRCRLINVPGRITRSGRRSHLHLPRRWPWTAAFASALEHLRAVALQI